MARGDTLYSLARWAGVSLRALLAANPGIDPAQDRDRRPGPPASNARDPAPARARERGRQAPSSPRPEPAPADEDEDKPAPATSPTQPECERDAAAVRAVADPRFRRLRAHAAAEPDGRDSGGLSLGPAPFHLSRHRHDHLPAGCDDPPDPALRHGAGGYARDPAALHLALDAQRTRPARPRPWQLHHRCRGAGRRGDRRSATGSARRRRRRASG